MRRFSRSLPLHRHGLTLASGTRIATAAAMALDTPASGSSARLRTPNISVEIPEAPATLEKPATSAPVALNDDMPQADLRRQVWKLTTPAIGEQLLGLGVSTSDTFLSGHLSAYASAQLGYNQATAVAAVGAAGLVNWIILTAFFGVNTGVTALVARATGARDRRLAAITAAQGALLGVIAGLIMVAVSVPLAGLITAAMGVSGEIAKLTTEFIRISSLGLPATGIASACTAAMRGGGDTRRPVGVMLVVNGVNVVASWLLLNGAPNLGIQPIGVIGSAIGAACGWTLGAILAVFLLTRAHALAPRVARADFKPNWNVGQRALRIGLPSAAELMIFQAGALAFNHQVVSLGAVPYAASVTINTVNSLGTLPAFGFSVAATSLVGQSLGARSPKLARRAALAALWPCVALMIGIGLICAIFPQVMMGLFIADPQVIQIGDVGQRLSLLTLPVSGATFIFNGALRGAGDTKFPMLVRAGGTWGMRVPLTAFLLPIFGLTGACFAMAIDFTGQASLAFWRFQSGKWRKARV
jgi:putative MATE family efflux protein